MELSNVIDSATVEVATTTSEISKVDLINEITKLMTEEGYTRMPKGKKYQGENMSVYEWACETFNPEITKREVTEWFKTIPELGKLRTKTERVNKVTILD